MSASSPPTPSDPATASVEQDTPLGGFSSSERITRELARLEEAAGEDGLLTANTSHDSRRYQNRIAAALLGPAAGLFAALHAKHPPSASHALRVALACSGWAEAMKLPSDLRDVLEAAALLHDLGKLGVPDQVLSKPGRLLPDEQALMAGHPQRAAEILASSGAPREVIDTVLTFGAWFDGTNKHLPLAGGEIPQAARMLAIADAFDAMTTDHVYRAAKPRERALAELFDFAGRQFDPVLVQSFAELVSDDQGLLSGRSASEWLTTLKASSRKKWVPEQESTAIPRPGDRRAESTNSLFEQKLVSNLHDGVVFVDTARRVFQWNTGAERLTGVSGSAAAGRVFEPGLLQMSTSNGKVIGDNECMVASAIRSGAQSSQRVGILGRSGRHVMVDLHVFPVYADGGCACGATIVMRDVSSETTLEEKCMALHAQATRDPLTQVANRAEFDRMLALFIDAHQETGLPCSLIMTDIDHFKVINDTYGHQAGDEAIVTFATLLKSLCRTGDLVARYGGEEFAVLCADCNNATAAARAEEIRKKLGETIHTALANHSLTASFGVTELQEGDTPETMLRRSDRALLRAKDQGRNQVVQLGNGMMDEKPKRSWFCFKPWAGRSLIDTQLTTNVPIELAIEKLRGFISDRAARILRVTDSDVRLEVSETAVGKGRSAANSVVYVVEIQFGQERELRTNSAGLAAGEYSFTTVHVTIRPKRDRDRRNGQIAERARMLLGSLKSYLMAREISAMSTPETAAT